MQEERLRLRALRVGALPILNYFIDRMGLAAELTLALKNPGYADALLALIKNIVVERNALYAVGEWAALYDVGLVAQGKVGDDRLGRARDRLCAADRATLQSRIVPAAIKGQDAGDPQRHHQRHGQGCLRRSESKGCSAQARAQRRAPPRSQAVGLQPVYHGRWRGAGALQGVRREPDRRWDPFGDVEPAAHLAAASALHLRRRLQAVHREELANDRRRTWVLCHRGSQDPFRGGEFYRGRSRRRCSLGGDLAQAGGPG